MQVPDWEEAELIALFESMDADGDGTVCYAEFAAQWAADKEAAAAPEA